MTGSCGVFRATPLAMRLPRPRPCAFFWVAALVACSSCTHLAAKGADSPADEEAVRAVERQRLKLLVAGDVEAARHLHADDFQLVNPVGRALSRDQYMQSLSSGYLDYVAWEPGPIAVEIAGPIAAIRYRSEIQVTLNGKPLPRLPHWHTDVYRKRNGRWQVVWSQATEIK